MTITLQKLDNTSIKHLGQVNFGDICMVDIKFKSAAYGTNAIYISTLVRIAFDLHS